MKIISALIFFMMVANAAAINKVVIKSNKFFDSVTGLQFYVKGVAYQPATDPIADINGLKKDIPLLQAAGINTIRCYQTDWTINHDEGMNLLAAAGIYLIVDLGDPSISVSYRGPWNTPIFENYRRKVDAFAKYTNTLAYLAGNEVILVPGSTINAAFVKASVRDTKAYIASKGYNIPVGYAGADVPTSSLAIDYLNCNNAAESVDFYGVNVYSWCGNANMQSANYERFKQYAQYSVPFIFTEYGCNAVAPRQFTEVLSIYGPDLEDSLSGAIVYEWHQEANDFGLVSINSNGDRTTLPDYNTFKTQLSKTSPKQAQMSTYTATYPLRPCPAVTQPEVYDSDSNWMSAASPLPPTPNNPQCECMYKTLTCRTNQEVYDYTVEPHNRYDTVQSIVNKVCVGENCYASGTAPQYGGYGRWSMCNSYEIVSFDINAYYQMDNANGCSYEIPSGLATPSGQSLDYCASLPNDYNSFSVKTLGNDPLGGPSGSGSTGSSSGSSGGSSGGSGGSGGSPVTGGDAGCGAGLYKCGQACYSPSQFCCTNGALSSGACSTTLTSSNGVATSNVDATSSSNGTPAPTSSSSNVSPVVTSSSAIATPTSGVNTPAPSTTSVADNSPVVRGQNSASPVMISVVVTAVCAIFAL